MLSRTLLSRRWLARFALFLGLALLPGTEAAAQSCCSGRFMKTDNGACDICCCTQCHCCVPGAGGGGCELNP